MKGVPPFSYPYLREQNISAVFVNAIWTNHQHAGGNKCHGQHPLTAGAGAEFGLGRSEDYETNLTPLSSDISYEDSPTIFYGYMAAPTKALIAK